MPTVTYKVVGTSDATSFEALTEIARSLEIYDRCKIQVSLAKGTHFPEFALSSAESSPIIQAATKSGISIWRSVAFLFPWAGNEGSSITLTRDEGLTSVQVICPDTTPPEQTIRLVEAVATKFPRFSAPEAINRALGPELTEYYQRREATLLRLEDVAQNIIAETHSYRLRLDEEAADRSRRLETAFEQRTSELQNQFSAKDSQLSEREDQLAKEKAQLDDRSARHVRRDSVKGLKGIIKGRADKFTLTPETTKKRVPIHAIFVSLLVVSFGVLAYGLSTPPAATEQGPTLWLHLMRIPAGILGFAFAAVFYIRWNDQWFRQHADEEFRLCQLELDIDRASWVTELALELRDEKGDLPAALVDRLSAGLFVSRPSEAVRHPSQDILSTIIGASSRLKLTLPGGIEADVSKGGIKKVQEELADRQASTKQDFLSQRVGMEAAKQDKERPDVLALFSRLREHCNDDRVAEGERFELVFPDGRNDRVLGILTQGRKKPIPRCQELLGLLFRVRGHAEGIENRDEPMPQNRFATFSPVSA